MAITKTKLYSKSKKTKTRRLISLDEKYTGPEPDWQNFDSMTNEEFESERKRAYYYYSYHHQLKDLHPNIITWMTNVGYGKNDIKIIKEVPDWSIPAPVYYLATMFLKGMPDVHPENPDKNLTSWVKEKLTTIIESKKEKQVTITKTQTLNEFQPSIQTRLKDNAFLIMQEIDEWLDSFIYTPEKFDAKSFNVLNYLKGKEINQFHAKIIKEVYSPQKQELETVLSSGKKDVQLSEAYNSYTVHQLKTKLSAFKEIENACDMFLQEAKVNRKPRKTKSPSKEKLVSKLNYKQNDAQYKIVSIKPQDILDAKELWVFNTKTRKLGCFIAEEHQVLSVKGTTIINFDEKTSVAKTLRKPEEQLKEFMSLTKSKQRKFFNEVKSVDTLMTGRINEDIVLLKVN